MEDPYIQPNGTLKNKLGITKYEELKDAEKDIVFARLIDIDTVKIDSKYNTDFLKRIHKHMFGDIFEWAGEFRTIPIYKTEVVIPGLSLEYSQPKNIEVDLNNALKELNNIRWDGKSVDEISEILTEKLAKLWRVHPFRDGNTRTTLAFR